MPESGHIPGELPDSDYTVPGINLDDAGGGEVDEEPPGRAGLAHSGCLVTTSLLQLLRSMADSRCAVLLRRQ